jgi:hypothetical protein
VFCGGARDDDRHALAEAYPALGDAECLAGLVGRGGLSKRRVRCDLTAGEYAGDSQEQQYDARTGADCEGHKGDAGGDG